MEKDKELKARFDKEGAKEINSQEQVASEVLEPKVEPEVYHSKYCPVECVSEVRRRMITNEIGRVLRFSSIDTPEGAQKLYRYLNGSGEKELTDLLPQLEAVKPQNFVAPYQSKEGAITRVPNYYEKEPRGDDAFIEEIMKPIAYFGIGYGGGHFPAVSLLAELGKKLEEEAEEIDSLIEGEATEEEVKRVAQERREELRAQAEALRRVIELRDSLYRETLKAFRDYEKENERFWREEFSEFVKTVDGITPHTSLMYEAHGKFKGALKKVVEAVYTASAKLQVPPPDSLDSPEVLQKIEETLIPALGKETAEKILERYLKSAKAYSQALKELSEKLEGHWKETLLFDAAHANKKLLTYFLLEAGFSEVMEKAREEGIYAKAREELKERAKEKVIESLFTVEGVEEAKKEFEELHRKASELEARIEKGRKAIEERREFLIKEENEERRKELEEKLKEAEERLKKLEEELAGTVKEKEETGAFLKEVEETLNRVEEAFKAVEEGSRRWEEIFRELVLKALPMRRTLLERDLWRMAADYENAFKVEKGLEELKDGRLFNIGRTMGLPGKFLPAEDLPYALSLVSDSKRAWALMNGLVEWGKRDLTVSLDLYDNPDRWSPAVQLYNLDLLIAKAKEGLISPEGISDEVFERFIGVDDPELKKSLKRVLEGFKDKALKERPKVKEEVMRLNEYLNLLRDLESFKFVKKAYEETKGTALSLMEDENPFVRRLGYGLLALKMAFDRSDYEFHNCLANASFPTETGYSKKLSLRFRECFEKYRGEIARSISFWDRVAGQLNSSPYAPFLFPFTFLAVVRKNLQALKSSYWERESARFFRRLTEKANEIIFSGNPDGYLKRELYNLAGIDLELKDATELTPLEESYELVGTDELYEEGKKEALSIPSWKRFREALLEGKEYEGFEEDKKRLLKALSTFRLLAVDSGNKELVKRIETLEESLESGTVNREDFLWLEGGGIKEELSSLIENPYFKVVIPSPDGASFLSVKLNKKELKTLNPGLVEEIVGTPREKRISLRTKLLQYLGIDEGIIKRKIETGELTNGLSVVNQLTDVLNSLAIRTSMEAEREKRTAGISREREAKDSLPEM